MNKKILLIRHGETQINIEGRMHLPGDKTPINKKGESQMKKVAEKLKTEEVDLVVCSTAKRSIESGKIIAEKLGIALKIQENIQERNWGDYSGNEWELVEDSLDEMGLNERYEFVPPNGESWKALETRAASVIRQFLLEHPHNTVAIVTHGGTIRALIPWLLNMPKQESLKHMLENGSISTFVFKNEELVSSDINNVSHLK